MKKSLIKEIHVNGNLNLRPEIVSGAWQYYFDNLIGFYGNKYGSRYLSIDGSVLLDYDSLEFGRQLEVFVKAFNKKYDDSI